MFNKERQFDRERIAGAVIILSILVIFLSMVGIKLLDVKVSNIELVDGDLYTVVTGNGPVNFSKNDILRIEYTDTKAGLTGTPIELDKIYTTKGFIYFSSIDPFYKIGQQIIQSVEDKNNLKPVWILPDKSPISGSTTNELQNANLKLIQPFSYAIGTPGKFIPIVFALLSIQYLAFAFGGIALFVLVFPLRIDSVKYNPAASQQDPEFCANEDHIGAVAK
ncbi:hypothetical protein Desaci_2959 [Desulfosporosinus acidiphilus SJ4]|uniref:Uncharacterized protein n=1 Tax=Desulfosporosinus acidiphilus (strain DSM 22704 / JCM 16185 / SJ4) TaxID=646529 RepID=I4D7U5_DESAJ|nr:hypothetical protein [Desulfosporosinus acidiphilus]AFM41869.1 hypothetical protein Desaci_2959 [Desulfosporosinus acidiphilus SJ4]